MGNETDQNTTTTNPHHHLQDQIGNHFLSLWRSTSQKSSRNDVVMVDDDYEELPSELDTVNSSGGFSIVLPDKLTVEYPSVSMHGHDVGVVQANRSAPVKRMVYYFEMYVKNAGAKGQVAIGFTTEGFRLRRQPGWEVNSYGYHGDDGLLYRGHGKGELFGPTYTVGDTVGGGINYASQELFFTKNGAVVGGVYKDVKGRLYPTVAVHSHLEKVVINFGKNPFVFDLKAYEEQERAKQQMMIDKLSVPETASYGIVRSYLQHYGYEDTLNSFDVASQNTVPPIMNIQENGFSEHENLYALKHRKILRELIRSGKIDDAFANLQQWYPQIIQDGKSATTFMLHCQKFIELVRAKKLEEAVNYGRMHFENFYRQEEYDDLVKDCAALLAYEQPQKSSVGYLLEESHREIVADAVNSMILSTNPSMTDRKACLHSYLERLLRQLTACLAEKRSLNGNQGEVFQLHRLLGGNKGL